MNIFNTIRAILRPKAKDSYTLPVKNYPSLNTVTKPLLDTSEMAFYCNLDAKTAAQWEMGQGPIRPTTEHVGDEIWIRWRTADVRALRA